MKENRNNNGREKEILFTRSIKAGKRIYYIYYVYFSLVIDNYDLVIGFNYDYELNPVLE